MAGTLRSVYSSLSRALIVKLVWFGLFPSSRSGRENDCSPPCRHLNFYYFLTFGCCSDEQKTWWMASSCLRTSKESASCIHLWEISSSKRVGRSISQPYQNPKRGTREVVEWLKDSSLPYSYIQQHYVLASDINAIAIR